MIAQLSEGQDFHHGHLNPLIFLEGGLRPAIRIEIGGK